MLKRSDGGTIHIRIINFDTHLEITLADNALKWMKTIGKTTVASRTLIQQ